MSYLQDLLGDAYREGMSIEDIDTALEQAGVGRIDADLTGKYNKLKDAFNKSSSETAKYKKLYNEKLSEEEQEKAAREDLMNSLREENENLKKAQTIAEYTAKFLSLGFDQAAAEETAKAMAEGDMNTVFANTDKVNKAKEKQIRADALKETPVPPAGGGEDVMTKDKFSKLSWSEQMDWIKDHPNWQAELK